MSPTAIVILVVVLGIICTVVWLSEPASAESPPESPEETMDFTPKFEGPTTCPSCGELALYSTIGTYTEQFGQGTTTIEGVTYWNCRNCMYSYDNH